MAVKLTIYPPRETSARVVEFDEEHVTIGRSSRCDIRLPFRVVSGHHLTIHCTSRSGYQVRDEASTNGTLLAGQPLPPGEDRRLKTGMFLEIVDLRIEVELVPILGGGIPLDKTGTMVRQMLGEALLTGTDDDASERAYFEVIAGSRCGEHIELPDDLDCGILGGGPDAEVPVEGLEASVEIFRDGDGFGVRPVADAAQAPSVTLGGEPLVSERSLASGDVLGAGSVELEFVDPLESYLAELDGLVPSDTGGDDDDSADDDADPGGGEDHEDSSDVPLSHVDTLTDEEPPQADADEPSGASWGLLEVGVIMVSLVLLAGVGYLLSSIFGLI